jgi:hypothetical protein
MQRFTIFLLFLSIHFSYAQLTGSQLLDKAIQYHDPKGNWNTFQGTLFVTMETPNNANRDSEIKIDLPHEYFYVKASRGETTTEYTVDKGTCSILLNGKTPSEEEKKANNLSCDRANLYKNYYTYLYGLPMKLKDKGTHIDEKVERKAFKEKEYVVLKVTYDQEVGNDTWFFYFDPKTYAMEVYQFLKDSKPNTGEYILLSGMEIINGIKMPKTRAWYYNKDDKYLGTDILKEVKSKKKG